MTLWWEDFEVGSALDVGKHTFGADEIVAFGRQFDPQPYHADPVAAKSSTFGGLIASGWHVCAAGMRMLTKQILGRTHTLGSPGVENVRWLKPVRAGDTLTSTWTVTEVQPKPHHRGGVVVLTGVAVNQDGVTVAHALGKILVRSRA